METFTVALSVGGETKLVRNRDEIKEVRDITTEEWTYKGQET